MTTDHTELRKALDAGIRRGEALFTVNTMDLAELLAAYDALAHPVAPAGKYSAEFEEAWAEYPKRPGASKAATWKAWQARIKAKVSPERMVEGARRYAAYCKAERTEPQYIKQAATFFGPGEFYDADWAVKKGPNLAPDARWPFPASSQGRAPLAQQQAAANEEAKRRLFGHRPPEDDMTFDMVPA